MTACLSQDFAADPNDIEKAIAPASASDIGDRMILVPQELDPTITNEHIRGLAVETAAKYNVVVIVPSNRRARVLAWCSCVNANSGEPGGGRSQIEEGTCRSRSYHQQVRRHRPSRQCVSRFDPRRYSGRSAPIDRIERSQLRNTSLQVGKSIQQIEQGMGRGVRANDDYCVVLLMGHSLTGQLFTQNGVARFTSATAAQFSLSEQIGNQLRGKGIQEIGNTLDYCLNRNPESGEGIQVGVTFHVKYDTAEPGAKLRCRAARGVRRRIAQTILLRRKRPFRMP